MTYYVSYFISFKDGSTGFGRSMLHGGDMSTVENINSAHEALKEVDEKIDNVCIITWHEVKA